MSKHTPGPWRYKPHSVDSNYMLIFCSNDPHEGDNLRGYCGEDNARLIAAAPDLLDALKLMVEQFTKGSGHSTLKDSEARIKAHAAIAKATGENQ